ncbi:NYN domain-containing protein [Patescibacteria group bacterium]|nr:NYN domain-containing protein [Patescibacteria group bacterium]
MTRLKKTKKIVKGKKSKKLGKKKQVVYAFIDSQNLNLGVRSQGWRLDFARFRVYLQDKYKVERAFLFIGYVSGNEAIYTNLQKAGYIVIFKPTLAFSKKQKVKIKGNVDVELVMHAMIEFSNYDKAIVVSGDGDFHCLLEHLELNQKLLKLVVPSRRSFSSLLRIFGGYVVFVEDLKKRLSKKSGRY